jgi:hypothetical protein
VEGLRQGDAGSSLRARQQLRVHAAVAQPSRSRRAAVAQPSRSRGRERRVMLRRDAPM